jgi:outer membrane autotransporter protein
VPVLGETVVARSEQDLTLFSTDLRVAYDFTGDAWYLRPMLDVDYAHQRVDAFRERGAGSLDLVVEEQSGDYFALRPAIEVGREFSFEGGTALRPFARIGTTQVLEGETQLLRARFAGTPAGVGPFTSDVAGDDSFTDVTLGFDLLRAKGLSVRFGYLGQFSSRSDLNSVGLKVWMPF